MNFVDYLFEKSKSSRNLFLTGSDTGITYETLCHDLHSLAGFLSGHYGSGKKILLMSENSYFFIVSYLAIIKSGNIAVLVESRIGDDDLKSIEKSCNFTALFIQEKFGHRFEQNTGNIYSETTLRSLQGETNNFTFEQNPEDVAVIIFTSGSTGTKKGVVLTHRNLIANTESILGYLHLTESDRMCVVLPFFYCYGASLLHTHIRVGGSLFLHNKPFLGSVIKDINRFECTGFAGVPSTFQILVNKTPFLTEKFPTLRYFTQAGGQLPNKYIRMIAEAFPTKDFYVMYGATEATARLSFLPPGRVMKKMGSVGKGIPGVRLEVLDPGGNPVKPGEIGEITAIGENIMQGYFDDPEETAAAIRHGRSFTGDLATIDDEGYIFIVGRSKNIIKSGGFRISPKEIEDLILTLPEITGCVVTGLPDEIMGEAICAVVQTTCSDRERVKKDIVTLCTGRMPSYKTPKYIDCIEEYPLNSSNKVDRAALRLMILDQRRLLE